MDSPAHLQLPDHEPSRCAGRHRLGASAHDLCELGNQRETVFITPADDDRKDDSVVFVDPVLRVIVLPVVARAPRRALTRRPRPWLSGPLIPSGWTPRGQGRASRSAPTNSTARLIATPSSSSPMVSQVGAL
jgi:hypothetical protein